MQMAQTPLHVSAGYNKAEIVKSLLEWPGNDKVELEAQNMVSKIHVVWHYLTGILLKELLLICLNDHNLGANLLSFTVWRNSIAHGSEEWM